MLGGAMWFMPPAAPPVPEQATACPERGRRERPKREKRKNDPKLIAAARELRDRWLEQVNAPGGEQLLAGGGKYDVSRALPAAPEGARLLQLPNAA